MGKSRGTLTIQLAGNIKHGGLGGEGVRDHAARCHLQIRRRHRFRTSTCARCKSAGLWAHISRIRFLDTPLDYEAFAARKGMLGHGGIVVFDDTVDLAKQARFAMEFCAIESCGKCTPCRVGSTRGVEVIDRIIANENRTKNLELLDDLCELMIGRIVVRAGRIDPAAGDERDPAFP